MNECRIDYCRRERVKDALYCHEHLNDAWGNRLLDLHSDGTVREPAWISRMKAKGLPGKDMTAA